MGASVILTDYEDFCPIDLAHQNLGQDLLQQFYYSSLSQDWLDEFCVSYLNFFLKDESVPDIEFQQSCADLNLPPGARAPHI